MAVDRNHRDDVSSVLERSQRVHVLQWGWSMRRGWLGRGSSALLTGGDVVVTARKVHVREMFRRSSGTGVPF